MVDFDRVNRLDAPPTLKDLDEAEARIVTTISDATAKLIAALSSGGGIRVPSGPPSSSSGRTFKFGRQKGQALGAGTLDNLTWYGNAIAESINKPDKAKWRDQNEADLAEINRHIQRLGGTPIFVGGGSDEPPVFGGGGDDEIPFAALDGRVP